MEAGLPSGTVTFLFTDIEGSTRLWETAPGAMRAALERHDAVLRSAVDAHGGYVFATGGDGIAAAFARAADALAAAVDAQRDLSTIAWPDPVVLRVRMGIHTGEATEHDGDYVGTAVSRAARLMSAAHGGQVVVSAVTEGLVRDALPEEVELVDLGEHRLRDLARPMRVFEAALIGLGSAFPPLRSLDAFPGNVPSALSSFVGRDREVAQAAAALEEGRLLTLTGVGGVGKTRLALQVAAEVLLRFRDGAWLCELAPVRDGAAVADALAAVFDLAPRTGQAMEQTVAEFLRGKELLLVLDNCEHLLGPVASVVERLERSCPHLSVIATSREGLSIEGERILAVPSLAAPPADAGIEAVASADAVRLFVDRARAVKAEFALTATNAAAVAQVCRRLDGVPLAIELAAARIPAMNPAELVRRLDRRFDVLAGGRRGAVERHQTLRAAIDWSYDMLDEPQRRLLARLSVFAGGCTPQAAEAVCGGDPVDAGAVWEMMAGLVARSLVVAEDQGLDTRYRLLETIRQYGEERLDAYGETVALRRRHAEYYASLGAALGDRSGGPDEDDALARLAADQDNFTRAMHSALDADDADLAFRLLLGAPPPAMQTGFGFRFGAEPVLSIPGSAQHPAYPVGLVVAAIISTFRGDLRTGERRLAEAIEAGAQHGAVATNGEWSARERSFEELVHFARMGLAFCAGAWREAAGHAEQAGRVAGAAGLRGVEASDLATAGQCFAFAGDLDRAIPLATEALALAREVGRPSLIGRCLSALASALAESDPPRASALLRESLEVASKHSETVSSLTQATLVAAQLGDVSLTLQLAVRAVPRVHWNGDQPQVAGLLNVVAWAAAETAPEEAAVLQGAARRLAVAATPASTESTARGGNGAAGRTMGLISDLRRDTTHRLASVLGKERLRELRGVGERMDIEEAVARVLALTDRLRHEASRL